MISKEVIIVGGFIEIIELCESLDYRIVGIIDRIDIPVLHGYQVIGNDEDITEIHKNFNCKNLILTPDKPIGRIRLYEIYNKFLFKFPKMISQYSQISKSAKIDKGTIIQTGCNVSSQVNIGKFVKLNTCSNVMHNAIIKDYTTVAPNAVILGHVEIGSNCYIGSNSTVLPYIKIADGVTIGAGAVVTKNIEDSGVYVGIPARKIKQRDQFF